MQRPAPPAARPVAPSQRAVRATRVIARNDRVEVAYVAQGVTLTVIGRATRDAAEGDQLPILNLDSGRTIDAVAIGPGRAVAGPQGLAARRPAQFASR